MDEVFSEKRPRINSSLLPKFVGQSVTVIGNVDAGKISADGTSFVLTDGNNKNIQVMLDSPLNDIIEGIVEVTGKVDEQCNVLGVVYRVFDSSNKFNLELYCKSVELMHDFPQFYGYDVKIATKS